MAQVHNIAAQLSKKATANLNANYAAAAAAAKAAVDTARKSYQLGTIRKSTESLEENKVQDHLFAQQAATFFKTAFGE